MEEYSEIGDILEDVSDEDLSELAKMYEEHKDWIPQAYSTIITAIEWKKKGKQTYLHVMSPNSCWKVDGTFFVYLQDNGSLLIFSLDKTGKNVYEALIRTNRLDGLKLFYAVHEMLYPTTRQFLHDKKLTALDSHNYMFTVSRKDALKYTIECPGEVYIKKLDKSYASTILWPRKNENSEKYLSLLLEMNDGYGIFLKSNHQLVSWMLLSIMGQLGALETREDHRRKGYGCLITKYMCKELAKMGHNPFATVLVENRASISLFEKLGFKSLGRATYIDVE